MIDFKSTKGRILKAIKKASQPTVEELARGLQLAPSTLRQQLALLVREGTLQEEVVRQGVGRPRKIYRLTRSAEELFPKRSEALLARILKAIAQKEPQQLQELLDTILKGILEENGHLSGIHDPEKRVKAVAETLIDLGSLTELERLEDGFILQIYDCPFSKLPSQFPQICRLPQRTLEELIGADVTLTEWLVAGDRRCSFIIKLLSKVERESVEEKRGKDENQLGSLGSSIVSLES